MEKRIIEIEKLIKEYKSFSKKVLDYKRRAYYVSTFHSTSIEGSTLTEMEVANLILEGKTANRKPFEHHLMVSDYYNALLEVIEISKEKRDLSLDFYQNISANVLKNTGSIHSSMSGDFDSSKGEYRKLNVHAGVRRFPDHTKVKKMTQDLNRKVNTALKGKLTLKEKLELSFYLHFHLVSIHPFVDGNGRLSRLMMNYIQSYFKLPLSVVFKSDRLRYIDALEKSREKENLEPFYKFMFSQYAKFLKTEIKFLKG